MLRSKRKGPKDMLRLFETLISFNCDNQIKALDKRVKKVNTKGSLMPKEEKSVKFALPMLDN